MPEQTKRFKKEDLYKLFTLDLERLAGYIDITKNLVKIHIVIGTTSPGIEIPEAINSINLETREFLRYYFGLVAGHHTSPSNLSFLEKIYEKLKIR